MFSDVKYRIGFLLKYLFSHIPEIIAVYCMSAFLVLFGHSYLSDHHFFKNISNLSDEKYLGVLSLLGFLLLITSQITSLWKKYRETNQLVLTRFIYIDSIVLFIVFTILNYFLFRPAALQELSHSNPTFRVFILISSVILLSWFLFTYFQCLCPEKEIEEKEISPHPLADNPIASFKHDLLNREKFVTNLYKEIENLNSLESFVFGLEGSWGEGKSSVIQMLMKEAKKEDKFIIVHFDPWIYEKSETILKAFYSNIEQAISKRFILTRIKNAFKRYQQNISKGTSNWGISLNVFPSESLEDMKENLEEYIKTTGKKILIIIDEIDRLQLNEMKLVFRIVRANAKFKNTIFLLSYDVGEVRRKLAKDTDPAYLDKIVQKPIRLPGIDRYNIDLFVENQLKEFFESLPIPDREREAYTAEFEPFYIRQLRGIFVNLRAVKRYLNSLFSSYPSILTEVYLPDFLLLEVLKVFFPHAYEDIWKNPWYYINLEWSDHTYFVSPFAFGADRDRKNELVKEHLEEILNEIKDVTKKRILREILNEISNISRLALKGSTFGRIERLEALQNKRLCHPDFYRKYFTLIVPKLEISHEELTNFIKKWQEFSSETEMQTAILNDLNEIKIRKELKKLLSEFVAFTDKIPKKVAQNIIIVIFENLSLFSKEGRENFWDSEFDKANTLLLWLLNDCFEKGEIENFIHAIIRRCTDIYFIAELVLHCKRSRGGSIYNVYEAADTEKIRKMASERMEKEFIQGRKDIFKALDDSEWGLVLWQWATNWSVDDTNKERVVSYAMPLLDDLQNFISLLKHSRKTELEADGKKAKRIARGFSFDTVLGLFNVGELHSLAQYFLSNLFTPSEEKKLLEEFIEQTAGSAPSRIITV